jgi:hypothetical protein
VSAEVLDALVLAAFAALLGLVVVLLVRGATALDAQTVYRRVQCPVRRAPADCVLIRDARTGRWAGVARCSLLPAGTRCNAACARLLEAGADLKPRAGAVSAAGGLPPSR